MKGAVYLRRGFVNSRGLSNSPSMYGRSGCALPAQDTLLRSHHLHFGLSYKRLEEGAYAVPLAESPEERRREITKQELAALLSGIDLRQARRRKRYQLRLKYGPITSFSIGRESVTE
jgi:hypothetical protein